MVVADSELVKRAMEIEREEERLIFLTNEIYHSISDMFDRGRIEPVGIEIHYGSLSTSPLKIYAYQFCQNIARKLLGMPMERAPGNSWEDAQRRAGYID